MGEEIPRRVKVDETDQIRSGGERLYQCHFKEKKLN